jgi:CDP-diacylglycerol---glycerol-3-phosphate 3-phosphatidyltransferase
MNLPMILTWGRIFLAPVFFILYELAGTHSPVLLVGAWAAFIIIEVSDLLDGHFARLFKQESELGKVLDPFADSLSRLTYFIAFTGSGIMPLWILLILVYRDISVAYIRVMTSTRNVMMSARTSGKLKAWLYAFAGGGGLAVYSINRLGWLAGYQGIFQEAAFILFLLAAGAALWSLTDYAVFFVRNFRKTS